MIEIHNGHRNLVSTTQAGALNTSVGDTIDKFNAVGNNK
jgi:hypothetical protein